MSLLSETHLAKIDKIIDIDKGCLSNKIFTNLKNERARIKKTKPKNEERPSWSGNTMVSKDEALICTYNSIDNYPECRCSECISDKRKCEEQLTQFKESFSNIKNIDEFLAFKAENKDLICKLLDLQLDLIKSEIVLKKWNNAALPIIAINKFKKAIK